MEYWYHGLENMVPGMTGPYNERLGIGIRNILELFQKNNVRATFFVLGSIAEKHPEIVKEIYSSGHEIASHGYTHEFVYKRTIEDFIQDVKKSLEIIEGSCGCKVLGFRAPFFSIRENTFNILKGLLQLGLKYDSSIYPAQCIYFGIPKALKYPHKLTLNGFGKIVECPLSVIKLFGLNVPFAGGFFLRFWNERFILRSIEKENSRGRPVMIYIHPFDLDPDIPIIKGISAKNRYIHYHNINTVKKKLGSVLQKYNFSPVKDVLSREIPEKELTYG